MNRRSTALGLVIAVIAAISFGMAGAFIKPLLEAGWSPSAAVTLRALTGGIVLSPFAIFSLRGRWRALWRARWRVLLMAVIGVIATQLAYFAAIDRIPVGTAILVEYMSPLLLVAFVWIRTRRMPRVVVLVGSVVALAGLFLVVAPDGSGGLDPFGLAIAAIASVGSAVYFVVAAQQSEDIPPVAIAASGLVIGGALLGLVGVTGLVPFVAPMTNVPLLGMSAPWWVPLLIVGVVATGIAYATSITASEILGSRLASFAGLLEVVTAALYAWILLGESLTIPQLIGGVLILAGIAFVRLEKAASPAEPSADVPLEASSVSGSS
jgi:drug/metabolite transporter (DMT)-like permease